MSVACARRKLSTLKNAKRKLEVSGDSTSDVRKVVNNLAFAFEDYIKSDNLSSYDIIKEPLLVNIEEHPDFKTAVRHLDQAIRDAEEELRHEEESERQRQAELQKKLLGGI